MGSQGLGFGELVASVCRVQGRGVRVGSGLGLQGLESSKP